DSRLVATTAGYADALGLRTAFGRFLTDEDDGDSANVAVLGSAAAEALFPGEDALGQSVRLGEHFYRVVGVLAAGKSEGDVIIPFRTARSRFGETVMIRQAGSRLAEKVEVSEAILVVDGADKVRDVSSAAAALLEATRPGRDWAVTASRASSAD